MLRSDLLQRLAITWRRHNRFRPRSRVEPPTPIPRITTDLREGASRRNLRAKDLGSDQIGSRALGHVGRRGFHPFKPEISPVHTPLFGSLDAFERERPRPMGTIQYRRGRHQRSYEKPRRVWVVVLRFGHPRRFKRAFAFVDERRDAQTKDAGASERNTSRSRSAVASPVEIGRLARMSVLSESQATRLKLINQFLAKADGKDKLCATIQVRSSKRVENTACPTWYCTQRSFDRDRDSGLNGTSTRKRLVGIRMLTARGLP